MTSTHYVISKRILKNTKDIIKKKNFPNIPVFPIIPMVFSDYSYGFFRLFLWETIRL